MENLEAQSSHQGSNEKEERLVGEGEEQVGNDVKNIDGRVQRWHVVFSVLLVSDTCDWTKFFLPELVGEENFKSKDILPEDICVQLRSSTGKPNAATLCLWVNCGMEVIWSCLPSLNQLYIFLTLWIILQSEIFANILWLFFNNVRTLKWYLGISF